MRGTPTFGSRPKQNPKSIWNRDPYVVIIRLSKCRSPNPKNQLMAPLNAMLSIRRRRIYATDTPSLWSQINSNRLCFDSTSSDNATQLGTICMTTVLSCNVFTSYHTWGNCKIPCSRNASLQIAMEHSIIRSTDPDSRFQRSPRLSLPHRIKMGRVALGNTLYVTVFGSRTSFHIGHGTVGIRVDSCAWNHWAQAAAAVLDMSYLDAREDGI